MTVFGSYADFYDLLYRGKNYDAECDFLEQAAARFARAPIKSILDLGCGTGGHCLPMAARGYDVAGVDQSEKMLEQARRKAAGVPPETAPHFHAGDIRHADLGRTFDMVTCLFAVLGYMTTNEDVLMALRAARRHLNPGGLFYFDIWFGPAVLAQRPSDRYRIEPMDGGRLIRFVRPEMDLAAQVVTVHYHLLQVAGAQIVSEVEEAHRMRFFFPQELDLLLREAGFRLEDLSPFMQLGAVMTDGDWNAGVLARAV